MTKKTILVTGGTSGIGFEISKFCKQSDYNVIVTGRAPEKLSKVEKDIGCRTVLVDSQDLTQIIQLANTLLAEKIKLDGLVLNAGVFYPKQFSDASEDDFDDVMNINFKGVFFTLQKLLPCMNNPSSVVIVSSIVVKKGFQGCSIYSASKSACEAFTRVANIELADKGIRINIVRPGITETEIQDKAGMTNEQKNILFDSMKNTALGRVLQPYDHVGAVDYLLSDKSIALRNAIIEIEGGFLL